MHRRQRVWEKGMMKLFLRTLAWVLAFAVWCAIIVGVAWLVR